MGYFKYALLKNLVKKPVYLIFFVTDVCNARCRHCFNWSLNQKPNDLTLDEIENFSKQLDHIEWLALSGGEPFERKDLAEICGIFLKNNSVSQITIPTNGLSPKLIYNTIKQVLELPFNFKLSVNLSIDGMEKTNDEIRGVRGGFKKAIDSVK